jgi:hypothetical protein
MDSGNNQCLEERMSGSVAGNPFGVSGVQGFGTQGLGQGQQQLTPQNWLDIVGKVAQVAVPVILSVLQNNPQVTQSGGMQAQSASPGQAGQTSPQFLQGVSLNPFSAGPQQPGPLQQQSIFGDIGHFLSGAGQQVVSAVTQHVAQQLPTIITDLISSLAASPQLRGQSAGLGGQIFPQSFIGDIGTWLGGAAQTIGSAAAQQVAQQLPNIIRGILSSLQNQPQQGQQMGAQSFSPGLYSPQSVQSSYAYH